VSFPDAASQADAVLDRWSAEEEELSALSVIGLLDGLAELRAQADVLRLQKQELIDQVLTPEIRQALADIDAECEPQAEALAVATKEATANVKAAVLHFEASVKGQRLHAVYSSGRERWDGKMLLRFATKNPRLLAALSYGDPSVSIRAVK
jgi:hypothetical protein